MSIDLTGTKHNDTLLSASNLANMLVYTNRHDEAKSFLREQLPLARAAHELCAEESIVGRVDATIAACPVIAST